MDLGLILSMDHTHGLNHMDLSHIQFWIHRPGRSDQTPSSFGEVILSSTIKHLSEKDWAFSVRSTALVGAVRGDTAISDPTSIGGRLGFCHQIHHPGQSDRAPSSFEEEQSDTFIVWRGDTAVSDSTSIGGQSGFCRQIQRLGRSDRAPSSFGETPSSFGKLILSSVIQLLLGDDQAFTVISTILVIAIERLRRLER
ncbi:hypothetical protein E6C27_scaffold174G00190 [Cucumis melo var. makuwa]|uniref:Uncharacterized protein n=1 Tax=Cucumis melo var. makuwa TaxID=1194695 RepID=A0A5A7U8A4_CUCMM|nr:hypothetical protein E6C27_scaffold174G00190 [Cucumis melo var. makuwa]